jgi:hypothetical protein
MPGLGAYHGAEVMYAYDDLGKDGHAGSPASTADSAPR